MHNIHHDASLYRPAAIVLCMTTCAAAIALMHHPVGRQVASAQEGLAHLTSTAAANAAAHATLILMYAIFAGCHALFAAMLGVRRPVVRLALTAYFAGFALLTVAMLLDGFVTPQVATLFLTAPEAQAMQVHIALGIMGVCIQVFTKAGLCAISLALIAFAAALAAKRPVQIKQVFLAALALLAGLLPAGFILLGNPRLAPANLLILFATHAAWHAGMGWSLFTDAPEQVHVPQRGHSPVEAQS